jgi:membrane fusion protein, multidrug efflux system
MRKTESVAVLSAVVTAGLCLISCHGGEGQAAQATNVSASAPSTPTIEVARVISQKLETQVRLPGEILPYEQVDVFAKVTGFVKWIGVDRGSKVRKGEVIARLEAPELVAQRAEADSKFQSAQSQLASARAKLAADQGTFERLKAAAKTPGVVAPNDLEIAQRAMESDQATVTALEKSAQASEDALRAVSELEAYLDIAAPFDGQVTTRFVHPGALAGPEGGAGGVTPIVRIETVHRHRLVVPVPEYDAARVPEGAEVNFTVPSFPGKIFHAPIARISHGVDTKTRTMPVELDVRDPAGELLPGTFSEVEWPLRRDYATLFVPPSAVATNLERTFVIRIREGKAEWVDVKTGATEGKLLEVFGDLRAGDMVAARGTDELRPGTLVAPQGGK